MIRHAKISEIENILKITQACAKFMEENGIFQWNAYYPSRKVFEDDIKRNELFVLILNEKIIGGIVLTEIMDEEYKSVHWITQNAKNLYIHRLFVHPEFQGQGHAQALMNFAEDFARSNHYDSIRLDTFSQNKRNQLFYEIRNYKKLEDIFLPNQSEYPFHCYELVL